MRLFQIKLAGFKTFVEPTTITIPGKLVGIVGPNGCGKSNVIDAVRWVLGESRAGTLRGDSIQDVIFSGSINRKPVGRASVELIFDNTLSKITNQWSSYTEISIKRVVQRDGDSAYFINNTHVRRRDIIDLFLGTGVSSRGYAIIEQGMISRIVEAKPQELRSFLEEAAGIAKYRERRHETELRLVDARSNLLRVKDILQELEKQLLHVKEQAATAQRFNTLQAYIPNDGLALRFFKRSMFSEVLRSDFERLAELAGVDVARTLAAVDETVARFHDAWLTEAPHLPLSEAQRATLAHHLASLALTRSGQMTRLA